MLQRLERPMDTGTDRHSRRPAVALSLVPLPATRKRLQHFGTLFGQCTAMTQPFATIELVAPTSATVMIMGESGSGKELVAQTIHAQSGRRDGPFVAINCGALPANLIESELFGHERGSFTGAERTHRGCFERADHGTLFLDEITEMPIDMQIRLLRVLESATFTRVGGDLELATDVRVIAASNRDLGRAVDEGALREDLLYRLCVIPVHVPPLREREGDALLLAEMFLRDLNALHGTSKSLTPGSRARIAAYRWPGNVRELKNLVHRAFVLSGSDLEVDTGHTVPEPSPGLGGDKPAARCGRDPIREIAVAIGTPLRHVERTMIFTTLRVAGGNRTRAAQMLGISAKTLYNRLLAYRKDGHHPGEFADDASISAAG